MSSRSSANMAAEADKRGLTFGILSAGMKRLLAVIIICLNIFSVAKMHNISRRVCANLFSVKAVSVGFR